MPRTVLRELADLPPVLPLFPLSGVLLLPQGRLPLNVFEPRYLAMTEAALAAPLRLIGMIQPSEPEAPERPPRLFPVGCAGRITSFAETDDGRYLITLSGVCRFTVGAELAMTDGYRRVTPDFAPWQSDLAAPPPLDLDREHLVSALNAYFKVNHITADLSGVADLPPARLVITLAMICPFDPQEKQALLEAPTLLERARVLIGLLEMAVTDAGRERARAEPRH